MAINYRSKEGETVDEIAHRYYGSVDGDTLQSVYDSNPGLIEQGPELPAGALLELPDITPTTDQPVRLWD